MQIQDLKDTLAAKASIIGDLQTDKGDQDDVLQNYLKQTMKLTINLKRW